MGLFLTVLIAVFLPFAAIGICLLSDICSELPMSVADYQRLYIVWQVGCSIALVFIFLFRALDPVQVHRTALKADSRTDGTNVCEQATQK